MAAAAATATIAKPKPTPENIKRIPQAHIHTHPKLYCIQEYSGMCVYRIIDSDALTHIHTHRNNHHFEKK